MILEKVYDELMAQIEDLKKVVAAMSGGSDDYDDLSNQPKVNYITLTGNKKSSDLKIAYSMTEAEYAAATKYAESIYCLQENATSFEEEDESASSYIEWSAGDPSGYVATWVYAPSNQNFTGCTAVECDDAAITVEGFVVAEGEVQVFLSCEDTAQIGETVTFTYTLTQPAGSTRIMKNGVQFGGYSEKLLYSSSEAAASVLLNAPLDEFDSVFVEGQYSSGGQIYNTAAVFRADKLIAGNAASVGVSQYSFMTFKKGANNSTLTFIETYSQNPMFISRVIGINY